MSRFFFFFYSFDLMSWIYILLIFRDVLWEFEMGVYLTNLYIGNTHGQKETPHREKEREKEGERNTERKTEIVLDSSFKMLQRPFSCIFVKIT